MNFKSLKDLVKSKSTNGEIKEEKVSGSFSENTKIIPNEFFVIGQIGSDIEDKKELEQKEEFEALGGLKCLAKMEEKISLLVRHSAETLTGKELIVLSDFGKKMSTFTNELRQGLIQNYNKHQTRREVFEEVISYLDKRRKE